MVFFLSLQLFGEAVLGLSQGSVSELLCKPKPWHMLSIKGREPFIRMQLWLNDPNNVDKLHALRAERLAESTKRKRIAAADATSSPGSPSEFFDSADSPSGSKKSRVLFSTKQKEALKIAFSLDPYPSMTAMEFLSQELNLEPRSISNWYHNHRMRLKQTHPHEIDALLPHKEDQRPLDPLHFRLLVNQRLLELSQTSSPPDSPAAKSAGSESSGLDLSQQRQRELDPCSEGEGEASQGSRSASAASSATLNSSGRSRRKPLAPQWVNPAAMWKESGEKGKDDEEDEEEQHGKVPNASEEDEVMADVD
jgi:homeobox protein cut-like